MTAQEIASGLTRDEIRQLAYELEEIADAMPLLEPTPEEAAAREAWLQTPQGRSHQRMLDAFRKDISAQIAGPHPASYMVNPLFTP